VAAQGWEGQAELYDPVQRVWGKKWWVRGRKEEEGRKKGRKQGKREERREGRKTETTRLEKGGKRT